MEHFWVTVGHTQRIVGPVRREGIARALRAGTLPFDTWIRAVGQDDWHRLEAWLVSSQQLADDDVTFICDEAVLDDEPQDERDSGRWAIADGAPPQVALHNLDFDDVEEAPFDPRMRLAS